MEPHRYESKLRAAGEELEAAKVKSKDALLQVDLAADLLLIQGGPDLVEAYYHGDVVEATDHMSSVINRLEALQVASKGAAKEARTVEKLAGKAIYGIRKLYGPLMKAGDIEREKRKNRQQRFRFEEPAGPDAGSPIPQRAKVSWKELRLWKSGRELEGAERLRALELLQQDKLLGDTLLVPPERIKDGECVRSGEEPIDAQDAALLGDSIIAFWAETVDWTGFEEAAAAGGNEDLLEPKKTPDGKLLLDLLCTRTSGAFGKGLKPRSSDKELLDAVRARIIEANPEYRSVGHWGPGGAVRAELGRQPREEPIVTLGRDEEARELRGAELAAFLREALMLYGTVEGAAARQRLVDTLAARAVGGAPAPAPAKKRGGGRPRKRR